MDTVELDRAVQILQDNKERWVKLSVSQKCELIEQLINGVLAVADRQIIRALEAKGIQPHHPESAEEWLAGPFIILRNLRLLRQTLEQIVHHGVPKINPDRIHIRSNSQVVVDVFPDSLFDKILYPGFRAEVWMRPEVHPHELRQAMASFYRQSQPQGKVALVLGAGNVSRRSLLLYDFY